MDKQTVILTYRKRNMKFFLRSGVGSLSLDVVFRLELFALSQPDISFNSVLDIQDLVLLY